MSKKSRRRHGNRNNTAERRRRQERQWRRWVFRFLCEIEALKQIKVDLEDVL
jgi:hypothetical protein